MIQNRTTEASLVEKCSDVFSPGVETMKQFTACLALKDGTQPKFMRARPVPHALKPLVEKELDSLEKEGIVSRVTHSE